MATNDAINNSLSGQTGTGQYVGDTSPTLVTPNIGAATGTSINLGSSTTISSFIDDDTFATASATSGATSESIKAYVDASASGSAATQAEMEAASSTSVYSSPGRQQYHPGHPKVWATFNGTGTVALIGGYNVTSITDNSTGNYRVNFTTSFSNQNYACVTGYNVPQSAGAGKSSSMIEQGTKLAASCEVYTWLYSGSVNTISVSDFALISVAFFGDQ